MRISLKKLFVTAAFGFVVGCAPATGGGDGGTCTLDTDCPDLQQCHPELGVCEDECTADTDCGGDRPVCNVAGDGGGYILEAEGVRDLCICDDTSCAAGEVCSDETGTCVPGEDTDAGPGPVECTIATEVADCGADAFCIDGTCEDACLHDDCLPEGGLCQYNDDEPEFNMCVPADDVTATCDAAGSADAVAGADDIVIYNASRFDEEGNACGQNGNLAISAYFLDVYSEEDLTDLDAHEILFRPGFTAGDEKFFQVGENVTEVFALEDDDGNLIENEYFFVFYICGDPGDEVAAQVRTDDNTSNAFCFDPQMAIED